MSPEILTLVYIGISSGIASIITGVFTYLGVRKKSMSAAFNSILDANERFRIEIKGDLDVSKSEAVAFKKNLKDVEDKYNKSIEQVSDLQSTIINYQKEITTLKVAIESYQNEIALLKSVIDDYRAETENLRQELKKFNGRNNH